MSERKLTKSMVAVLEQIYENYLKQHDACIVTRHVHSGTAYGLLSRGLIQYAQGYGYGFGGLLELTDKGKQELKRIICDKYAGKDFDMSLWKDS